MDAFQDGNWHDALRLVQQNVVYRRHSKQHPIRKGKHRRWVVVLPLLQLVEVRAESDAGGVRFYARKHESWLIDLCFQESVNRVLEVRGVGR